MRTLRAAFNNAIALKLVDIRCYPFHNLTNLSGYKISELETATIMKNLGTPTAQISEGLGHPDERTTQIYLEDFENSVLDEANRKLLE